MRWLQPMGFSQCNRPSLFLSQLPKYLPDRRYCERIFSVEQAMQVAQQYGISISEDQPSVNDIKRKLMQAIGAAMPLAQSDFDSITSAKEEDTYNRDKLRGLYLQTADCLSNLPSVFRNDLEKLFPQFETRMKKYTEELKSSHCVQLFAGEMGCGKSSLVNLLLGVDLMPTSDLQCTAAIVEISYGKSPQAILHFRVNESGRSQPTKTLTPDPTTGVDAFLERIQELVARRDEDTDESPFQKIQLLWPIEMLQGGVTIVDSPGVGGADGLPNVLSSYLKNAFGFIYVIDITVGIHLHRLGQLLLKVIEANEGYDHNTTLFVCSHWDMVKPEETDRVTTTTIKKLDMFLPPNSKVQIYPISVKQSAKGAKYGLISNEHKELVEGIRNFLPQTMKGKLRIYYRYLSSLLKRVILSVRVTYGINREAVERIRRQYTDVERRLAILQKNPQRQLERIKKKVKEASVTAGREILAYLGSMIVSTRLSQWSHLECPRKEKSWSNVLKNANAAIVERVAQVINTWGELHNFVKSVDDDVIKLFRDQFQLFDEQLEEIQGALLNGKDVKTFAMMASGNDVQKRRLKKQKTNTTTEDSYLSIGAAVVSSFNLDSKDPRIKELFKHKYATNPTEAMKEATILYLSLMNEQSIAVAVSNYFDRHMKGIDNVGSMLPNMVKNDKELLVKLSEELQRGELKLSQIQDKERKFCLLQEDLDMFYVQRLIVPDFTTDQVIYQECIGSGAFANVYKGTLRNGHVQEQVALKVPMMPLTHEDVTDVLLEEFMLRDLKHRNIIKYFGVNKQGTDDVRLIFVMEYCPFTLKEKCIDVEENSPSHLRRNPLRRGEYTESVRTMTRYVKQICDGLTYLHSKSIVHRDLKPENILMNTQDVAKIADLGLAKKVKDLELSASGTPIFMAPEALLQTDKSNTKVDIYSFGMIIWQMWYGKDLVTYASSEITEKLQTAMLGGWRPSLSILCPPTTFWADLIRQCWNQDPRLRPSGLEINRKLEQFEPELDD